MRCGDNLILEILFHDISNGTLADVVEKLNFELKYNQDFGADLKQLQKRP